MTGKIIGPYHIIGKLGEGGMGEVWRATDTNLGRQVAIKVLPDAFAQDRERLARFEREAKTLAALNHPNIAILHGLEKSQGTHALVMELVEGPTLADVIARGHPEAERVGARPRDRDSAALRGGGAPRGLEIDDALNIARQIAEALEAAHEQGIIHRDLKPANIKIRDDGTVKVLDFGLAKSADPGATSADVSHSPTITSPAMTQQGVVLGTAAYMSPEQARGKPVDRRSDIWAFGCVLYEMLTGKRAFPGEDVSDTAAAILRSEPDWNALPASVTPSLRRLLRRCLQKDRKQRFHDIGDVRLEMEVPGPSDVVGAAPAPTRPHWYNHVLWLTALTVSGAAAAGLVWWLRTPVVPLETRLDVVAPWSTDMTFALSPDGRRLAYVAPSAGRNVLWLRELDSAMAKPLERTDNASNPFWSPDSLSIGFFEGSAGNVKLKRLDLATGTVQAIADAWVAPAAWAPSNVILYRTSALSGLAMIPVSGGEPTAVTKLANGATSHTDPQFLPDGRQFLFHSNGPEDVRGIYLGSLGDSQATRLTDADALGRYIPTGWLAYLRQNALVARRFDLNRRSLSGETVLIADRVIWSAEPARRAGFSVSAQGTVAYRTEPLGLRQLIWFDRNGKLLGTLGQANESTGSPELSPDGKRAAVHRDTQGATFGSGDTFSVGTTTLDVWLIDAQRSTKLTSGSSNYPIWSPDGARVAYLGVRNGKRGQYLKSADDAADEELLVEQPEKVVAMNAVTSWSRDNRLLLLDVNHPTPDIWVLPLTGDRKPYPFLNSNSIERLGHFSPNGRWIAYQSNESGRAEIYVRRFPGPGGKARVSTAGGAQPRWSSDGTELYWIARDATLMAAAIKVNGEFIEVGPPFELFQTKIYLGGSDQPERGQYNVAPDGRFLINTVVSDDSVLPITILQNWKAR